MLGVGNNKRNQTKQAQDLVCVQAKHEAPLTGGDLCCVRMRMLGRLQVLLSAEPCGLEQLIREKVKSPSPSLGLKQHT